MNNIFLSTASQTKPALSPALVAQEAVRRLPRWALLALSFVYVLAGFWPRSPWKSADIAGFGLMQEIAQGRTSWLAPQIMGQAPEFPALLPYGLGAWVIQISAGWLAPDVAARIPFACLLALALVSTWYGTYYLARLPGAQPVRFAFGGEAHPVDYARSLADGSLLALMAMLGLAQLGHETTPSVAQLAFSGLLFYAVAASMFHSRLPALMGLLSAIGLALSGSSAFGLALVLAASAVRFIQKDSQTLRWALWLVFCALAASALALSLGQWNAHWARMPAQWSDWLNLFKLWVWFTWPAWPLALLALWRWRAWIGSLHIAWPLAMVLVMAIVTIFRPNADRSLLLALPALACLAAMALPTLHRSVSALIDWFTLIFFSFCGLVIWVVYLAMRTGSPAQPAANVRRLLPGFEPSFSALALLVASLATAAWIAVIVWRTGRHRAALWKSFVLPASGATLCWLLLTTLWLPMLDYARSYAPMVSRVREHLSTRECVHAHGLAHAQIAALKFHGGFELAPLYSLSQCKWLITDPQQWSIRGVSVSPEWQLAYTVRRRSNDSETFLIYRQTNPSNPSNASKAAP